MRVATGKVIAGKVVVEGLSLNEGELVTVLTREAEETVHLSPDDEAELLDAIAEAERGDTISDLEAWKPLWDGYNAFYGRKGETALPQDITETTWRRFFDSTEPVFALVAESEGKLVGLTHYLFHRSTTRTELTCYLQDLFTVQNERGRGIGRRLIEAVYEAAKKAGVKRVYWQTHQTNAAGRLLYDKVAEHMGFIVYAHDV